MFNALSIYRRLRAVLNRFVGQLNISLDELYKCIIKKILTGDETGKAIEKAVDEAMQETKFLGAARGRIGSLLVEAARAGFDVKPEEEAKPASEPANRPGTAAKRPQEAKPPAAEPKSPSKEPKPPAMKPKPPDKEQEPPDKEAEAEQDYAIVNKLTHSTWAPDDLNLSERLHPAGTRIRQDIVTVITAAIRNADTVQKMALDLYDGYNSGKSVLKPAELPRYLDRIYNLGLLAAQGDRGAVKKIEESIKYLKERVGKLETKGLKAGYTQLLNACGSGQFKEAAIRKAAWVAVQERTRYYAMRIARTEAARAWYDGLLARYQDDDEVWGYQWQLSSRHKYVPFDQCDVCANMNVGFGKGRYPKGKVPTIPRHPHCMCMIVPVYVWEIDAKAAFNPKLARKYLDSLDDVEQRRLFGVEGAQLYKSGGDWQKLLRGWDGFVRPKSRLENEFQSDAGNGIMKQGNVVSLEQAKKRDHKIMITGVAIDKVSLIKVPGFTAEQNLALQEAHKEVLRIAKAKNDSNEVLGIYNIGFSRKTHELGDEFGVNPSRNPEAFSILNASRGQDVLYLHNHPSTNRFSITDIFTFIKDDRIKVMSVVTNQGGIHLLSKNDRYSYEKAMNAFRPAINQYKLGNISHNEVVDLILKTCAKGGIEYERSK